jgi:hypothetical protein
MVLKQHSIQLLRVLDNQLVEAKIVTVTKKHLNDASSLWKPLLTGTGIGDEDWNWREKSRDLKLLPGEEFYAVECENMTQGLMLIQILNKLCQIESQHNRRLVYVEALATAPWNRPAIQSPPTYKGVGGNLINLAITRSEELNYQGRIALHALPSAIAFYKKLKIGLLDCGSDPSEPDNLVYFETVRRQS